MAYHKKYFTEWTKEKSKLTKMLDNLYLDRLRGKISKEQYDKFYQTLHQQLDDLKNKLAKLEEAEDNYYLTTKHILGLTNQAYDLFISSEVEQNVN